MKKIKKAILLSTILLLLLSSWAIAQETQIFDSTYTINDKSYFAKYQYYLRGEDTVYNGQFELKQQFENQEHIHEYLSVEGDFVDNQADQKWKLRKGIFEPTGPGYYKNYTYSYDVNGYEFMALGQFNAGAKEGTWKLYDWQIRNSVITDTTLIVTVNFQKDKALGSFSIKTETEILEGLLGESEMTTGIWSFYKIHAEGDTLFKKEWVFENNMLSKMRLISGGITKEIKVNSPDSGAISEHIISLDHDFLEVIELKASLYNQKLLEEYREEDKLTDLYFKLLDNLELVDNTFSPITKSNINPLISSKLIASDISSNEADLLEKIKEHFLTNQKKTEEILNSPQFNITSASIRQVAQFKNIIEDIDLFFLQPTEEILSLHENQQLQYFNRNELLQYKINLEEESSIYAVFKTDSLSEHYAFQSNLDFSADQSNLSKLASLMEVLGKELDLIEENLEGYLGEIQEGEKLLELEKTMLNKYEQIKYLADSLITGEHDNFAGIDVAKAINHFADAELEEYSGLSNVEQKLNAIEPLLDCFNRAQGLIYTIQKAPESIYKINEAYTKEVFNPYTFTNMEEKAKPPIYKAFNKLILPGIFQNMQNLTCGNMTAYQSNFQKLYEEMIELLNSDNTNRMERKVKRAKTAEKAAEILEMELSF